MPETETESPLLMDLVPAGHEHRGMVEKIAEHKTNSVDDLLGRFSSMRKAAAKSPGQFPGEGATQAEIQAWGRKIGAPVDTTQYAMPEADGVLGTLMEALRDGFAEAGIHPDQAKIVSTHFHGIYSSAEKSTTDTAVAEAQVKDTEWAQQYGAEAATKQIEATAEIQKAFGEGDAPIDRNHPALKDLVLGMARAQASDGMPQHQAHPGAQPKMTVKQAAQRMDALGRGDAMNNPAHAEYVSTVDEFQTLQRYLNSKGFENYAAALDAED